MTRMEWADRRIADLETELARVQFEESTPRQIEANLARETLQHTLDTAVVFATAVREVLDQIGDSFEENVERMARDLNGRE